MSTTDTAQQPLLSVRGLSVRSAADLSDEADTLVSGIDFEIFRGERVGLIGESGSGKSLTCLSIIGLLSHGLEAEGTITLDGESPTDLLRASQRQLDRIRGNRLSMVFQEPMTALNPLMKVGDQLAEVIRIHQRGSDKTDSKNLTTRVTELLSSVRIPEPARAAKVYPHQLSGGQRQRVMLAMAMANEPDLLLADEPTTALDVTVQKQVLHLMSEQVQQAGSSLLFITHDLGVVSEVCDRVLIMREGRILESGPIDRVFTAAEHPYTQALLDASALVTRPGSRRLVTADAEDFSTGLGESQRTVAEPEHLRLPDQGEDPVPAQAPVPVQAPVIFNESQDPAIRVRNLTRTYGSPGLLGRGRTVQALRGVSFDVATGQRFGIVGESGSGKSTLLRLLTALDAPTSGSVEVTGEEITGRRERQLKWLRRRVQIVFQDPMGSLDPRMRISEIITEPLHRTAQGHRPSAADRRRRVEELLEQVGLPRNAAQKYPHEFSGGQRQRIAIARALVTTPKILIADEAVSALDVSVRAQVLNLLDDLVDQYRLTMVFVSHDLNVIRHSCDAVAVMREGQIVEAGSSEAVLSTPQHPYTAELAAAVPRLSARSGEPQPRLSG